MRLKSNILASPNLMAGYATDGIASFFKDHGNAYLKYCKYPALEIWRKRTV